MVMTPERWEEVGRIFDAVAALQPEERSSFLDHACGEDEALRREVQSLLAVEGRAGDFLGAGAMEDAAKVLAEEKPPSLVGKQLGHYEVLELIQGGNMGEVYRARDAALKRLVAVKVLPLSFSQNADRLRRFKQEPLAASALNHPNIVTIHEIGAVDHWHFMVSEFVEGETLRQRMIRDRIKVTEALEVTIQIASALEAVHRVGIVHRDIKPENVMVRPDGLVKVLDFGLAKLTEPQMVRATQGHATESGLETRSGMIMGTTRYMSPEQARGVAVDARSDIWSLGVVLYEMVTGFAPFVGATDSDVMVSILEREPPSLTRYVPEAPQELQRIANKALRKDREERYPVVKDLLLDLKSLKQHLDFAVLHGGKEEQDQSVRESFAQLRPPKANAGSEFLIGTERHVSATYLGTAPGREWGKRSHWLVRISEGHLMRWMSALAVLSLIAVVAFTLLWRSPRPPRIVSTRKVTNDGQQKDFYQLATDGSKVYFSEDLVQTEGFLQVPVAGGEPILTARFLEGAEAHRILYDISTSGNELLVGSAHTGDQREEPELWVMSVLGGPGRRLAGLHGQSACWSPDAQRVAYAEGGHLYIAKSDGTESRELPTSRLVGFLGQLSWSPDGSRLRFNVNNMNHPSSLWEISVDGTNLRQLLPGWKSEFSQWAGRWTPDGRYYVFLVNDSGIKIWALDETKSFFGMSDPQPIQLTFGPMSFGPFVFSPDGKNLFAMGYVPNDGELVRYDIASGHWLPFLSGIAASHLDFSRDGNWVSYVSYPNGLLWRSRADGSQKLQLSSPGLRVISSRWSPDGKQIAFTVRVSGQHSTIYLISVEGGNAERIVQPACGDADVSWSRDGKSLLFGPAVGSQCNGEIYLLDLKSRLVSKIAGSEGLYSPRCSPDGSSIVAITADGSRLMLFKFATQRWDHIAELARSAGWARDGPEWSNDGKSIYCMNNSDLVLVDVADRKVGNLVSLTGILPLKEGSRFSLASDNSPVLLRETTVYELYALNWEVP
jgi:serine/threonine protein kinase/Tol biopolymer transport system component